MYKSNVKKFRFRSSTEVLFRKKHLQIVFATETLSLGINMPCKVCHRYTFRFFYYYLWNFLIKSVIMPADCIYFDNIYYRHMIGRAGRRGYDTFGNVGKFYYQKHNKYIKISKN